MSSLSSKEIFILTQWFPPEQAPVGYIIRELADALSRDGWNVTVVTGFPNHPTGDVLGGYAHRWFQEEFWGDVRIWRCFLVTSSRHSFPLRVLSALSFTVTSALAVLLRGRPDVIFALLQPLTMGAVLPVLAKIKGARLVFNLQDLHPDGPIQLGLVRNPRLITALRWLERAAYSSADAITVICESFKAHCLRLGVPTDRVAVIPNWINLDEVKPQPSYNGFRQELGLGENDFVVLYAGNLGLLSGIEALLETAKLFAGDSHVKFVLVGEGALAERLKAEAGSFGLKNVIFAPFQPRKRLGDVQAISDVSLVSMKKGHGATSVPSKVLGYMAAGRPVLAMVDEWSESAKLVSNAGCGLLVSPGDSQALAAAIRELQCQPDRRKQMGSSGRYYLEKHFSNAALLSSYTDFLKRFAEPHR